MTMGETTISSKPRIHRYDEYIITRIKELLKQTSNKGILPNKEDVDDIKQDLISYITYINEYNQSKEKLESLYRYMEYIMLVLANSYNEMYELAEIFKSFIALIEPEL